MQTFKELYDRTWKRVLEQRNEDSDTDPYNPEHLDCLLNPSKHPIVIRTGQCVCSDDNQQECIKRCPFDAMKIGEHGVEIDESLCVGCSECVRGCAHEKLTESTDIVPALKAVRQSSSLVYAIIAPAFLGQFSPAVTPGKLRTALKEVGFDGMIEAALFADILTLKEALEFDEKIQNETDYQLTSCCCPMWIAMIRKIYHQLMPHVPGSVSPMVACGRVIKELHPDALTIFIGPCLAKKAEAREADLAGAVDYVLTFKEMQNIFDALGVEPEKMEESEKDHSSRAGRIYAKAGGVSEAVEQTVKAIHPDRKISVRTQKADGVPACKQMIQDILEGKTNANFFEGMGCRGGCVGGPRSIVGVEDGTKRVELYGAEATYQNPVENPYVLELLNRLGLETIDNLLEDTEIFTRHFN